MDFNWDIQDWTLLIVGLTFLLYIGIAIWSRAGSTKEFYVAGGGVSPLANGMATAADWMSAASFISMAGLIAYMYMSTMACQHTCRVSLHRRKPYRSFNLSEVNLELTHSSDYSDHALYCVTVHYWSVL